MSKPNPMDIRAIERNQNDAERKSLLRREQELDDLRRIMETPEGRRFMARLLAMSGVGQAAFTGNSTTFYNNGRQSLGVELQAELREHAFDKFIQMQQECKQ